LGHDLGGAVAQVLAIQDPDRIERLVLADCPAYDNWPSNYLKGMISMARLPSALQLFIRRMKGFRFARSSKGWGHGFFDSRLLTQELATTYIRPLASSADRIQRLKRLLLRLWSCDNRHRSPSWAIKLYHDIPGAKRFELIPFAGLFSPEEKPEEFAQIVINFLAPRKKKVNSEESNSQQKTPADSPESLKEDTKE
jgi:pimeloyl-ACP methyl ester carboxylesterase